MTGKEAAEKHRKPCEVHVHRRASNLLTEHLYSILVGPVVLATAGQGLYLCAPRDDVGWRANPENQTLDYDTESTAKRPPWFSCNPLV